MRTVGASHLHKSLLQISAKPPARICVSASGAIRFGLGGSNRGLAGALHCAEPQAAVWERAPRGLGSAACFHLAGVPRGLLGTLHTSVPPAAACPARDWERRWLTRAAKRLPRGMSSGAECLDRRVLCVVPVTCWETAGMRKQSSFVPLFFSVRQPSSQASSCVIHWGYGYVLRGIRKTISRHSRTSQPGEKDALEALARRVQSPSPQSGAGGAAPPALPGRACEPVPAHRGRLAAGGDRVQPWAPPATRSRYQPPHALPAPARAPCPRRRVCAPLSRLVPTSPVTVLGLSGVPELLPLIPISNTPDFSFFSPKSVFAIKPAQAEEDEKMNHSYENIWLYFKQDAQQVQQQRLPLTHSRCIQRRGFFPLLSYR